MPNKIKNIVFDLGGVLIDWNPRYLYNKIFSSSEAMENFLATVCTQEWNEKQDAGRSFLEATNELVKKFPHLQNEISAYDHRWEEMIRGPIEPTVQLLQHIHASQRYKMLALSNWSQDKFPVAERLFPFLQLFEGIVVSGKIRLKKPDPQIFHHLCKTHAISPSESLFIDDAHINIAAARELGFLTIHYTTSDNLRRDLAEMKVL